MGIRNLGLMIGLSLLLVTVRSLAATYTCNSFVDSIKKTSQSVDTTTNFEYVWLFRSHPNLKLACGTPKTELDRLVCRIEELNQDQPTKTLAESKIRIGDQYLFVHTDLCVDGSSCSIECFLSAK
jgi:hypothetical protein